MPQQRVGPFFAIRRVRNPLARQPFYVVLVAGNGQPVSRSVERFVDKSSARGHIGDLLTIIRGPGRRSDDLPIFDQAAADRLSPRERP